MKRIAVLTLLSYVFSFSVMAEELPKTELQPAGEPAKTAETVQPQIPVKIGYVDIAKIASDSVPGKAANIQLKEKTKKLRSQITGKQKTLEKMKKDLEAQLPTLPPPSNGRQRSRHWKRKSRSTRSLSRGRRKICRK